MLAMSVDDEELMHLESQESSVGDSDIKDVLEIYDEIVQEDEMEEKLHGKPLFDPKDVESRSESTKPAKKPVKSIVDAVVTAKDIVHENTKVDPSTIERVEKE